MEHFLQFVVSFFALKNYIDILQFKLNVKSLQFFEY